MEENRKPEKRKNYRPHGAIAGTLPLAYTAKDKLPNKSKSLIPEILVELMDRLFGKFKIKISVFFFYVKTFSDKAPRINLRHA